LIGGEFVKARSLALVVFQTAKAVLIEEPEIELAEYVTLVGASL